MRLGDNFDQIYLKSCKLDRKQFFEGIIEDFDCTFYGSNENMRLIGFDISDILFDIDVDLSSFSFCIVNLNRV